MSVLALGLMLAGCGGSGSGEVDSTPPPPPSYIKIADMQGNRTFQTGGVQYNLAPTGGSNGSNLGFGSGVTVAYTAASDSYTLTAPGGATQTFAPSDLGNTPAGATAQFVKTDGNTRDVFTLIAPVVNGVPLSYAVIGTWMRVDTVSNTGVARSAVGGAPTVASDVPKTGTATYDAVIGGSAVVAGTLHTLPGNSTATFSANFAAGTVQTTLDLKGTPVAGGQLVDLGSFSGSASLASGGPGFAGNLSGTNGNGVFSGALFGPQAAEMAYGWFVSGGNFNAAGNAVGAKR